MSKRQKKKIVQSTQKVKKKKNEKVKKKIPVAVMCTGAMGFIKHFVISNRKSANALMYSVTLLLYYSNAQLQI